MSLSDKVLATVRTMFAAAAGYLITYLAEHYHLVLSPHDSALVQGAALVLATAVYHVAVSWAQRQWPKWERAVPALKGLSGVVAALLGSSQQPSYTPPASAPAPVPVVPIVVSQSSSPAAPATPPAKS